MKRRQKLMSATAFLIAVAFLLYMLFVAVARSNDAECETLKKIGAHRGESIMIFGDMPTWKLECLFDNGGQ